LFDVRRTEGFGDTSLAAVVMPGIGGQKVTFPDDVVPAAGTETDETTPAEHIHQQPQQTIDSSTEEVFHPANGTVAQQAREEFRRTAGNHSIDSVSSGNFGFLDKRLICKFKRPLLYVYTPSTVDARRKSNF
jgi:hypothetical protein